MSTNSQSIPNFTVVDLDGDLVITVGETKLKVSSKILCVVSPVFKTFLLGRFVEGQSTRSSNEIRQVELHDDDTEALSLMCGLLHHTPLPANRINIDRLEKLAFVVDKYDCERALYYWARWEISALVDIKDFCRLLWPAYAFGEAQFFTSLTKRMVLHFPNGEKVTTASAKYGLSEEVESHLPAGVIDTIYLAELQIKRDMQMHVENLISRIASKHTPADVMSRSDEELLSYCDCGSIGSLFNALSKQAIWPLTSSIHQLSIAMFCKELEACDFGLPKRKTKTKKCTECPEIFASEIKEIKWNALEKFEGLCLDCIKTPEKTEEQRTMCRVPHRNYRGLPRQMSSSGP